MKINIRSAAVGLCGAAFALAVAAGTASATTVPTWGQPHLPGDQILQVSKQGNSISQTATATAKSTQFLPTNVNVAPSLFSVGSNDGGVKQGNVSSANANAQNDNQSFQGNGVVQAVQPVKGTPGSPSKNRWGQQGGKNHGQGNPCQPKRQPKPYGPQGPGPQGPGPQGPQGPGPQGPRASGSRAPGSSGSRASGSGSELDAELYSGQQHRAAGQRLVKEHAVPADQRQRCAFALQRRLQRRQRDAGQRVERQRQRPEREPVVPGQWRRAERWRSLG